MKTIFKLASRYIIKGKARTISSFVGIVLSSFLVTTVLLVSFSIYHSIITSNAEMYGGWHIAFTGGTPKEKEQFIEAFETEYMGNKSLLGYSNISAQNSNIHICVFGADNNWFEIMNVNLIEGVFPREKGEVLVSKNFYEKYCAEGMLLDKGEMQLYNRYDSNGELLSELVEYSDSDILKHKENINYKIVGIYDGANKNMAEIWFASFYTYSDVCNEEPWIYVQMDNPENVYEIGESISSEHCIYNRELLNSLGATNSGENTRNYIIAIAFLALFIVIISTILLIANSFMNTFNERIKQVGVLLSLGMKKWQVFILTLFESGFLAVIAIPIGMIISILFTYLIVGFYGNYLSEIVYATVKFEVVISPCILLIIFLVSFFVMLLSSLYPAFASRNIDIISSIRQNDIARHDDIKISKKKQSVEEIIVKRNFKKYKKKYFIARLSLVISVVLLISFKILCHHTIEFLDIERLDFDIIVDSYDLSIEESKDAYNKYILGDKRISKSWWIIETSKDVFVSDDIILSDKAKEHLEEVGCTDLYYNYLILDNTTFENIFSDKSQMYYYDPLYTGRIENGKYIEEEYTWFNGTSEIHMALSQGKTCSVISLPKESESIFKQHNGNISGISIIISESAAGELVRDLEMMYTCYIVADDHNSVAESIERKTDFSVFDIAEDYETQKNSVVTIDLISKGFSGFIWLFSCVNTLFTILTNISTRKKEFAILMSLGINKKNTIIIFTKECLRNLGLVSLGAYGLCIIISIAFWFFMDAQKFYFPIGTAVLCFIVNLLLYFVSYLTSFFKIRSISIADELKID